MRSIMLAGLACLIATPALAEDRDYCPERPGLDTPACTIAAGHVSVETAIADWTHDAMPDQVEDTVLIGDTLVRVGLTDAVEAQVGWTPFGHDRTRDTQSGAIDTANRVGDVTLGLKANLSHPDGKGFSLAVLPTVTLPVGRRPIGGGDWAAGVRVPVTYDLSDSLTLQFTPEVDAAADEDGHGRHLAYSGAGGLGLALTKAVTATAEVQAMRDDDPSGRTTQWLGAVSLAWMASKRFQIDVGGVAGLNRNAPDHEIYAGIARQF